MSVYLIDYENVHYAGWDGIDDLTEADEVYLFYSDNAQTIPMELSIKVAQAKAKVSYIHVDRMAKNYLDFQLSALTGFLVATTEQTEFVVVSKDTGFDAVLDFWNHQTISSRQVTFTRRPQIREILKKTKAASTAKKKPAKKSNPKNSNTKNAEQISDDQKTDSEINHQEQTYQVEEVATNVDLPEEEVLEENLGETEVIDKQEEKRRKQQIEILKAGRPAPRPRKEPRMPKTKTASNDEDELTEQKPASKVEQKSAPKVEQKSAPKVEQKPAAPGDKLTKEEKGQIRDVLEGVEIVPSEYIKIYKLFRVSADKHEYNISLVKAFNDQEKGNQIYKATQKLFEARHK